MGAEDWVKVGFAVLPTMVAIAVACGARNKAVTLTIASWMGLAAILAQAGILSHFERLPPPMVIFLLIGFAGTILLGRSSWVERLFELPWQILVGFHAFRILVEILIHKATTIGLAPPQMSWHGYNFDIVTGVTALCLAPFAASVARGLIMLWNCLGLTLLAVVVGIAAVSFPTRFQLMKPDNSWVASFPYVWLPAILVMAGLLGHIMIFRKLRSAG